MKVLARAFQLCAVALAGLYCDQTIVLFFCIFTLLFKLSKNSMKVSFQKIITIQ